MIINIKEGDRIHVNANVICYDSRELTGVVEFVDVMSYIIYIEIDEIFKIDENDDRMRLVPGYNDDNGWQKIL